MKVLIVEDEAIVSLMAEMIVEGLGHEVIGPAATIECALDLLEYIVPDAAILDVNIAGERVYPVADRLIQLGVPFAFTTGYDMAGLEERFRDRIIQPKPYGDVEINRLLNSFDVAA